MCALLACATKPADRGAPDGSAPLVHDAGPIAGPRDAASSSSDGGPIACERVSGAVVLVPTDDGLTLEADLYTSGVSGGPGVVLLHMIPPSNDRTNYPPRFREALAQRGMNVLNLNRRGAGGDAALARTAYSGPNGKLDAKAGYDFLTRHSCAIDPRRIAFVGASNGTTTALDFALHAAATPSIQPPKALVFLTGGTYTETNNRIADHRTALDSLPILFVFSTAERQWSAAFQAGAPGAWVFQEYDPGDHGTRMFQVQGDAITLASDFIVERL